MQELQISYFQRRARQELSRAMSTVSPEQRQARLAFMREFERRATEAQRFAWP